MPSLSRPASRSSRIKSRLTQKALVHVRAVGLHPIVKALASHLNFLGGRILHRVVV
jgi:hypothetical protein